MIQKDKIGVLVFPAGEVNAVELHDALSACVMAAMCFGTIHLGFQ